MFDAGYQKGELMITRDDIVIRKAILHILDTDRGDCILSSALLNPGPEMHDFIRNHIYKIVSSDDTKNCVFDSEFSPIYAILESWDESNDASFIETSQTIANKLYAAMGKETRRVIQGLDDDKSNGIIRVLSFKHGFKEKEK